MQVFAGFLLIVGFFLGIILICCKNAGILDIDTIYVLQPIIVSLSVWIGARAYKEYVEEHN